MDHFGEELRRLRQAAGLSLRSLAERVAFDYSYLAQVERGSRPGSSKLAQQCDEALGTGGRLTKLFARSRSRQETPPRRAVLQAMGALAGGGGTPLAALEATRQGLAAALGDVPDTDAWEAIAAGYAREFFTVAPAARWWQTARSAADLSGDRDTRAWVRAWSAVNGLYEHRPLAEVLDLVDETLAI